jgi:hypothetical protein
VRLLSNAEVIHDALLFLEIDLIHAHVMVIEAQTVPTDVGRSQVCAVRALEGVFVPKVRVLQPVEVSVQLLLDVPEARGEVWVPYLSCVPVPVWFRSSSGSVRVLPGQCLHNFKHYVGKV